MGPLEGDTLLRLQRGGTPEEELLGLSTSAMNTYIHIGLIYFV